MIRKIIQIDEARCTGCGLCAQACHEGAIGMVNGKAKLLRDDYCDGLGDCLPACPAGAIKFIEREAAAYDEAAVHAAKQDRAAAQPACGCPGSRMRTFDRERTHSAAPAAASQLRQWPVQIKLVPVKAPFYAGADLLIAADCTAYACGDFHDRFLKDRIVLIGCPKLDEGDYTQKLTQILLENDIRSVTVVRMEVPCCGGLERAAKNALQESGKQIPLRVATLSADGQVLRQVSG